MRPDACMLLNGKRCVQVRACCTEGLIGPAEGFSVLWNEVRCSGLGSDPQREFLLRQVRFFSLYLQQQQKNRRRERLYQTCLKVFLIYSQSV